MPERVIQAEGQSELAGAVLEALRRWLDEAEIVPDDAVTAAVRFPGAGLWRDLVEERVIPVSRRLYEAAVSVVDGTLLESFLDGVRSRIVDESTLISDIQRAAEAHGDQAASLDWGGVSGDAAPWRSRAALIGEHEAQVTSMQAATDDAGPGARKRWRTQGDGRVRPSHRRVNGQELPLDESFSVDGSQLQFPGQPNGPIQNWISCRCELLLITPESETASMTTEADAGALTASVTVDREAPIADDRARTWDSSEAVQRVRAWATENGELDEDRMARAFLWRTEGPPSDWKLPVADVIDGRLTLVWRGITAAAGAVQGARTPLDLPESAIEEIKSALNGLYDRAADKFDDDSIVPPWKAEERTAALTAAVNDLLTAAPEWRPPVEWFADYDGPERGITVGPAEQHGDFPTARVSGYLATWNGGIGANCHMGYQQAGQCVPPPRSQDGGVLRHFHQNNRILTLDDGSQVHPGVLTTGIGHGDNPDPSRHDNPEHMAAVVVAGEDETGIWVNGAVLPRVAADGEAMADLRFAAWSGEWYETPEGDMALYAATGVVSPGYSNPSQSGSEVNPESLEGSGYALAASLGTGGVGLLAALAAQMEACAQTLGTLVAAMGSPQNPGAPAKEPEDPGEPKEITARASVKVQVPEDVPAVLASMALEVLAGVKSAKTRPSVRADGVELPQCIGRLKTFLESEGSPADHATAAAVGAVQRICRSRDVQHAAVRMEACRALAEFRARGGKTE